nr:sigma-70 family RNA polymerase sigma factor [Alkaliphilus serpentinus]
MFATYTLNHHVAEDLTQETFTIAFYKLDKLKNINSMKSWLYRIAYNQAMQFFRLKRKNQETIEKIKNKSNYYTLEDKDYDLLIKIKEVLTTFEMSLLILIVVEEMSYAELSTYFDKKPATLRKQYERIRKKLQAELDNIKEGTINA